MQSPSSQRGAAPCTRKHGYVKSIYPQHLFNNSSHLRQSHSNSNSWAARSWQGGAEEKKKKVGEESSVQALFNLAAPLKQPWMSGTGTKSGVLFRDSGFDSVTGSGWHLRVCAGVMTVCLLVWLYWVCQFFGVRAGKQADQKVDTWERNVKKQRVCSAHTVDLKLKSAWATVAVELSEFYVCGLAFWINSVVLKRGSDPIIMDCLAAINFYTRLSGHCWYLLYFGIDCLHRKLNALWRSLDLWS